MLLVTGGTGFIGSHLLERLDAPARCIVRRQGVQLPPWIEAAHADLATGEGLAEALRGVHTIIHLAGVTKALRTQDYYTGNARATENLARAIAGRPVRLVHVSSLAAVGPNPDAGPVAEDAVPRPLTHYGKSKLEAEQIVRALAPEAVIVRPPVVYGPRDTDVFQLLRAISKGLVLEIAGGERWFSAIYVEDLAEGLLTAARAPQAAGRTYFLTHPEACTWRGLAATAGQIMGRRARTIRIPAALAHGIGAGAEIWARATRRPGIISREKIAEARCARWTCDYRRAAEELGFTASTSLEAGLAKALVWYREAGWLTW